MICLRKQNISYVVDLASISAKLSQKVVTNTGASYIKGKP